MGLNGFLGSTQFIFFCSSSIFFCISTKALFAGSSGVLEAYASIVQRARLLPRIVRDFLQKCCCEDPIFSPTITPPPAHVRDPHVHSADRLGPACPEL